MFLIAKTKKKKTLTKHPVVGIKELYYLPDYTNVDISRKRKSSFKHAPVGLIYRQVYRIVFLINDCYGKAQSTVSSTTPGKVVLDGSRKQAKPYGTSQ